MFFIIFWVKFLYVPIKMMAQRAEDMTKKESLGTGTGPSSAKESDGTKVTLGMMSTALSALAVVYATTY